MTAEERKTTHDPPTDAGRDPADGSTQAQPGVSGSGLPVPGMPGSLVGPPRHPHTVAAPTASATLPPLTDSPWFWVCMFATAALLGLTIAQPKYGRRQAQIEKQYQGREFSVRGRAGTESNQPYSTPDDTLIGLGPLFWVFGIAVAIAWAAFWRQRFRQRSGAGSSLQSSANASPGSREVLRGARAGETTSSELVRSAPNDSGNPAERNAS